MEVVGVRHHSPASARRVARVIRARRPRYVLIEGPADLNPHLDDLRGPHKLPIAVFSFVDAPDLRNATWSPLCDYSPEWVALQTAWEVGAEAFFIDLPGWARHAPAGAGDGTIEELCRRFFVDDVDALWDHLFEDAGEAAPDALFEAYFSGLRSVAPEPLEEREQFMSAWVGRAAARGETVVVCGGWHAPALRAAPPCTDEGWPEPPAAPPGARTGAYLVPWSFHRLDAFTGYAAGMPSPGWYQALWESGPLGAEEALRRDVLRRLRGRKQPVSVADSVNAATLTGALARLRGHLHPTRVDVLDGLAGALLKEAVEQPHPWSRRGPLPAGSDPVLVEIVAAFSGERVGQVAKGTRRPPLPGEVEERLLALDLREGEVVLDLEDPRDRERSVLLHQLSFLKIPGYVLVSKADPTADAFLREGWRISRHLDSASALIEASAWGATLGAACQARLEKALAEATDLGELAGLLVRAVFLGLAELSDTLLGRVEAAIHREGSFGMLGVGLGRLLALWRSRRLGAPPGVLSTLLVTTVERGLWLAEGMRGGPAPADPARLAAMIALRDTVRYGVQRAEPEAIDPTILPRLDAVCARIAADVASPFDLRGAALGARWSLGTVDDGQDTLLALRLAGRPGTLGDFLAGLFALAREECSRSTPLVAAVDETICDFGEEDFLVALPSLRLAFGFFPPVERAALAQLVLPLHGGGTTNLLAPVDAEVVLANRALELAVEAWLSRWGLLAGEGPGG